MSHQEQQENEEMRRQEDEALERSLRISAAAEAGIRSDQRSRIYGGDTHDTAPDGRPLMINNVPYAEWCKPHKDKI